MSEAFYFHNQIAPKGGDSLAFKPVSLFPMYPRQYATGTQDTVNVKMGYCDLGAENSLTHVAANETYHASHVHVRRHAEYFQMVNGDVYFVNKKGQIGYIPTYNMFKKTPPVLLENAENYFSWNAGVSPNIGFESLSIKCDKYEGTGTLFDAGNDVIKHPQGTHTLKRPIFHKASGSYVTGTGAGSQEFIQAAFIGFQTSENTCSIYSNGYCIYRGEYDGRRFPVAYNYRDGRFFDFRHPDQDGSGACQSLWAVPALDEHGKIIWTMPDSPVVYEDIQGVDYLENDPDTGVFVNPVHYPSPVPALNLIPLNLSLVWHWWTAIHPMSIVKGGLVDHPQTEPGYYTTGYKRYFSFHLVRQGRCPPKSSELEGGGGCSRYDFTGSYFGDLSARDSTFKGVRLQSQVGEELDGSLKVSDVTPLSVDAGLWLMTPMCQRTGKDCPDTPCPDGGQGLWSVPRQDTECPGGDDPQPPPCGHYRESMAVRIASDDNGRCCHYDFPSDVPLHNQIRGFTCDLVDGGQKARIIKRQKLFTCCQETRRITSREHAHTGSLYNEPKPMPFNWSLAQELSLDPVEGRLSWQTFASQAHNERNFPTWWQKYIETFYLYQSQPLAATLVQIFNDTPIVHPEDCEYEIDPITGNRVLVQCYDEFGNPINQDFSGGTTPSGWTEYNQPDFSFFDYVNQVASQQFMQIRTADTMKPGCYVPLWMRFESHKRQATNSYDVAGTKERIYHPLPWYTFRFDKLEDSSGARAVESAKYYTAVFERTLRGSAMHTAVPDGVTAGNNNGLYTTSRDGGSVLNVLPVGTDFTSGGNNGANAAYGIVPYDVVEVGTDAVPHSHNQWSMYDGSQMVKGEGNYQEYLDYSRAEHQVIIPLDVKAGNFEYEDFEYEDNADTSYAASASLVVPSGSQEIWAAGGTGELVNGDQGTVLSMESVVVESGVIDSGVDSSKTTNSFVSSDGTRPTSENDTSRGWNASNVKSDGWELSEPHAAVEYYEDFAYVKGDHYRRLYFRGAPVHELPEAWELGWNDSTEYEFAFISKHEFVLYYPVGAGIDAYVLQVWNLSRDEQGRIESIRPSLTHYFEGIEQYAMIASTIVISDHYLCFATQVYWREFFRMHRNGKITIYDTHEYSTGSPGWNGVSKNDWTSNWTNSLDKSHPLTDGTGITESGIPVMKKDAKGMYMPLKGFGYYAQNDIPDDVYFSTDYRRLHSVSINIGVGNKSIAVPNMHKFMCFYRACPTDDFTATNPSREPEFVPSLCHMTSDSVRLRVLITRETATIWQRDDYDNSMDARHVGGDRRFPLVVYKGEWLAFPRCRQIQDSSSNYGYSTYGSGYEFVFDTETIILKDDDGIDTEWRRQVSVIYSTSLDESTGYYSSSFGFPHLRIVYWQGNEDYYWERSGAGLTLSVDSHEIIGDVLWHWEIIRNGSSYRWYPSLSGYGDNYIDDWALNRENLAGGSRTGYSIIDDTEWRIWFNKYTRETRTGAYESDIMEIYDGAPPFGSFDFEFEVFWPRIEEVYPLTLKQANLSRFVMGRWSGQEDYYYEEVEGHVAYESYTFEQSYALLYLYEAWAIYDNVLYIRNGKGWRRMIPPMDITVNSNGLLTSPKVIKECYVYGYNPTYAGVVDRVLYFTETNPNNEYNSQTGQYKTTRRLHVGVFLTDGRASNEWVWGSIEYTEEGTNINANDAFFRERLFNIPHVQLENIGSAQATFADGGVVIKNAFTKLGTQGDCTLSGNNYVLATETVDVIFRDGRVMQWREDVDQSTAGSITCCEWWEWTEWIEGGVKHGDWVLKRQPGISCLGMGITVNVPDDPDNANSPTHEEVNPVFREPPLCPAGQSMLISDGSIAGTAAPRSVPCDQFGKENACPDGSECGSGGPGLCADGTPCPGQISQG